MAPVQFYRFFTEFSTRVTSFLWVPVSNVLESHRFPANFRERDIEHLFDLHTAGARLPERAYRWPVRKGAGYNEVYTASRGILCLRPKTSVFGRF